MERLRSRGFVTSKRFELNGAKFALIRAFPETGRMHQIRVHLAESGHAVVGDKIYGPDETCYLEFIETGWSPRPSQNVCCSNDTRCTRARSSPTKTNGAPACRPTCRSGPAYH